MIDSNGPPRAADDASAPKIMTYRLSDEPEALALKSNFNGIFPPLKTAQIGASGVLLIQYLLLKRGIDSSLMTTDDGIDLVAYSPSRREALTVQVKTCLKPKRAGGKGALTLDWWLRSDSPAQLVGLVDLESNQVWMFWHDEFVGRAQQKPEGRMHLYFYLDEGFKARPDCHRRDFETFRLEGRIEEIFGPPHAG